MIAKFGALIGLVHHGVLATVAVLWGPQYARLDRAPLLMSGVRSIVFPMANVRNDNGARVWLLINSQ